MRGQFISRREALTLAVAAAGTLVRPTGACALVSARGQSGAGRSASGARLVIRNARPLDAESPIEALRTFETSNDLFFVRSHHALFAEGSTPWTLTIDGEVARPATFGLEDLRRLPAEHRSVTIECAGNGRAAVLGPHAANVLETKGEGPRHLAVDRQRPRRGDLRGQQRMMAADEKQIVSRLERP